MHRDFGYHDPSFYLAHVNVVNGQVIGTQNREVWFDKSNNQSCYIPVIRTCSEIKLFGPTTSFRKLRQIN